MLSLVPFHCRHLLLTRFRLVALSGGPQEGVYFQQPHHMQVNLPRNISDADLIDPTKPRDFEEPLSVPTSTSYLIQRVKLATICRKIVDAMPISPSRPDLIPYEDVIAMDMEFEKLLQELPPFFQIEETQGAAPHIQAVNCRRRRGVADCHPALYDPYHDAHPALQVPPAVPCERVYGPEVLLLA